MNCSIAAAWSRRAGVECGARRRAREDVGAAPPSETPPPVSAATADHRRRRRAATTAATQGHDRRRLRAPSEGRGRDRDGAAASDGSAHDRRHGRRGSDASAAAPGCLRRRPSPNGAGWIVTSLPLVEEVAHLRHRPAVAPGRGSSCARAPAPASRRRRAAAAPRGRSGRAPPIRFSLDVVRRLAGEGVEERGAQRPDVGGLVAPSPRRPPRGPGRPGSR